MSPRRASVGSQRAVVPGVPRQQAQMTRLPRGELQSRPAISTTTPTAIGATRVNAGCRVATAAIATPSGKTTAPSSVQTEK